MFSFAGMWGFFVLQVKSRISVQFVEKPLVSHPILSHTAASTLGTNRSRVPSVVAPSSGKLTFAAMWTLAVTSDKYPAM